jgi:hypothetical protein
MTQEAQEKSTESEQAKSTETQLAEILELFGPPPVLSSEDIRSYQEIMARLLEEFAPRDFMGRLLIKELTDSNWEVMRYSRHTTLLMERRFRESPRISGATPQECGTRQRGARPETCRTKRQACDRAGGGACGIGCGRRRHLA